MKTTSPRPQLRCTHATDNLLNRLNNKRHGSSIKQAIYSLYKTLMRSRLDYGSIIYSPVSKSGGYKMRVLDSFYVHPQPLQYQAYRFLTEYNHFFYVDSSSSLIRYAIRAIFKRNLPTSSADCNNRLLNLPMSTDINNSF